jgi:hypothetical protein
MSRKLRPGDLGKVEGASGVTRGTDLVTLLPGKAGTKHSEVE